MAVLTTTVRQQGNSAVTTVPSEVIRRLAIEIGAELSWVEDGLGGFRVTPVGPDTVKSVAVHEEAMRKYDSVFRALAK